MDLVVKGIKLKAAANLPFKYKAHFRRDFFDDILSLVKKFGKKETNFDEVSGSDIDIMYNIFWTCAKIADDNIPEKEEFFGKQEELTVVDIFENIAHLLEVTFDTKKK
mgnify:FL=1|nr:MAG TPA: tail assembly chaperone protein [Caudoviricetes sp.]